MSPLPTAGSAAPTSSSASSPPQATGSSDELLQLFGSLLAAETSDHAGGLPPASVDESAFLPTEPETFEQLGLPRAEVDTLVLRCLLFAGVASGRRVAEQLKLPFHVVQEILHAFKSQLLVRHACVAKMSDYEYELTETGYERARRLSHHVTYCGAAPVPLDAYLDSVRRQTLSASHVCRAKLRNAFADLLLPDAMVHQIGQSLHAGRALFLYGKPGNGKTSIAERVLRATDEYIWIPRALLATGELIRLFDPNCHEEAPLPANETLLNDRVDKRWVRIRRPTIVVGGELTLAQLEVSDNVATGTSEAPLQLKSNGGALIIDDFGRQLVTPKELLNRWIVPLEKGFDFLTLRSGRQLRVPFDQILVFATNLEPREIVDEAFLRRIPYKIEVKDPTEAQFRELLARLAPDLGLEVTPTAVDYLIVKYYRATQRPFRYCHARDLLRQVVYYCEYNEEPLVLSTTTIDAAATNYFAGL